ncbi:MAG TPA: M28 family peptidase [Terriglobia bacterium]|nr:M28 family peptidase [Terriglobia bacterium]
MKPLEIEGTRRTRRRVNWLPALVCGLVLFVVGSTTYRARSGQGPSHRDASLNLPPFNSTRAFDDLNHLVSFGPRPAGSAALARSRQWIEGQLAAAGVKVDEDKFTAATPVGNLDMANLIVRIPGASPNVVIVCGHYDTKRFDQFKFVGANDGGSSAALVMELARAMARRPVPYTLWFLWTDGEEAVRQQWQGSDNDYGSRHLEQELASEGNLDRVKAFILVDMIGDAKLDIRKDPGSTPWLTGLEFSTAQRLGYSRYFLEQEYAVGGDDYDPWLAAGVPSVDIIDFDYGPNAKSKPGDPDFNIYWHTAQDTVAHCSALSLEIVGRVVLGMLQSLASSPHLHLSGNGFNESLSR